MVECPTCGRTAIKLKEKTPGGPKKYCDVCVKIARRGEKPQKFRFNRGALCDGLLALHKKYGYTPEDTKAIDHHAKI